MRSPIPATSSSRIPARRNTTPSSACRSSSAARRSACGSCGRAEATRAGHAKEEKRRLKRALKESVVELADLKERLSTRLPEFDGGITDAHRLMLEDPAFARKLEAAIHDGLSAEAALKRVVE